MICLTLPPSLSLRIGYFHPHETLDAVRLWLRDSLALPLPFPPGDEEQQPQGTEGLFCIRFPTVPAGGAGMGRTLLECQCVPSVTGHCVWGKSLPLPVPPAVDGVTRGTDTGAGGVDNPVESSSSGSNNSSSNSSTDSRIVSDAVPGIGTGSGTGAGDRHVTAQLLRKEIVDTAAVEPFVKNKLPASISLVPASSAGAGVTLSVDSNHGNPGTTTNTSGSMTKPSAAKTTKPKWMK